MRAILSIILAAAALVMSVGVVGKYLLVTDPQFFRSIQISKAIESEAVRLLATDRIVTQVFVKNEGGTIWTGLDAIMAVGTVTMLIGIDMKQIEFSDETVEDNGTLILNVPQPSILSTELDIENVLFMRKATALNRLADLGDDDRQLTVLAELKTSAQKFATEKGLIPSREDVQERLRIILSDLGVRGPIVFGDSNLKNQTGS